MSSTHITVLEAVAVLPQASVAVKVLVLIVLQVEVTTASEKVIVGVLQASVAVAFPNAAFIAGPFWEALHNKLFPVSSGAINGTAKSSVHVTVLDVLAVLPQASTIVHDLVCERLHPVLDIDPSVWVTVGVLQASVDVALPNAASIAAAEGLHPGVNVVPLAVIETILSKVQLTVLETVDVLPQPSLAVNVLVCVRPQPLLCNGPSAEVSVTGPQASLAVAEPKAALMSDAAGLHASARDVPVAFIVGGVRSEVHVTVLETEEVLPQASVAINVLVCDAVHELIDILPSEDVMVGKPHPSVAVAFANAALTADDVGLHPKVTLL